MISAQPCLINRGLPLLQKRTRTEYSAHSLQLQRSIPMDEDPLKDEVSSREINQTFHLELRDLLHRA